MGWMDGWMDVQVLTYCVKLFPKRKNDQSAYIMGCQNVRLKKFINESLSPSLFLSTTTTTTAKKKEPSALKKRFVSLFPNVALALTKINLTFLP